MNLQDPESRMSTTYGAEQGTVYILDPPDVVAKKVRSAVTDSGSEVRRAPDKPGIANLIDILSVVRDVTPEVGGGGVRRFRLRRLQVGRRR